MNPTDAAWSEIERVFCSPGEKVESERGRRGERVNLDIGRVSLNESYERREASLL